MPATRWYATREAVKAVLPLSGANLDQLIDQYIEGATADTERMLGRRFIPLTATKYYRWPTFRSSGGYILHLDDDLLALTTLKAKAQDASPVTIVAADYFLEPANEGPPYSRIEIDLSSSAAFEAGDTPQRPLGVTGSWGYGDGT